MIEVTGLTKRFGAVTAVDDLSFTAPSGAVTGLLGPNGAGKSTTLRVVVGLDHPTAGDVRIDGTRYADLEHPLRTVGAHLDVRWVHKARSARTHLRWLAAAGDVPDGRVDEVLELVGLTSVAGKRVGGFSLGMLQRLGIAGALLGDPQVLLLDEPFYGLEPEGVGWLRTCLRTLAAEGRTVLVASNLHVELAQSTTELVVVDRGRLVAHGPTVQIAAGFAPDPAPVAATERVRPAPPPGRGAVRGLLVAERIKLLSSRSPWWCSAVTLALVAGVTVLLGLAVPNDGRVRFADLTDVLSVVGTGVGTVLVGAMCAAAVTSEFKHSTIRATFLAQPRRTPALLAKAAVVTAAAVLVGLVVGFVSWAVLRLMEPRSDLAITALGEWRAVAGVGAFLAVVAIFALALGLLVRRAFVVVPLVPIWVLVAENLIGRIPGAGERIWAWLPFVNANRFLTQGVSNTTTGVWTARYMPFEAWGSLLYALAVVAAVLAVALVVVRRRDA